MGFIKALLENVFMFVLMMGFMLLMRGVGAKIRGEFGFFVLTGIALFMLHNKVFQAVSSMSKGDPMMPVLSISRGMMICGSILHVVYMQTCVTAIFFAVMCIIYQTIPVQDWSGIAYCYVLVIAWSIAVGLFFLSIQPLAPVIIPKIAQMYRRIGMITSGKMIPGNMMGMMGRFHGIFIMNPLFHLIDQTRGFTFQHYNPFISSLTYPIEATAGLLVISAVTYFAIQKYTSS